MVENTDFKPKLSEILCCWFSRVRLFKTPCPWDSPGKDIGVGCHFLLQMKFYPPAKKKKKETHYFH